MKRRKLKFIGSGMVILFLLSVMACRKTPVIEVEHFWSRQDVSNAGDLVDSMGGLLITRAVTLYMKPPFYKGSMPLQYKTTAKEISGGGMMSSFSTPAWYDFGSWHNLFVYKDRKTMLYGMPDGAVAVSKDNNTLVAECKVIKLLNTDKQLTGIEIDEIHYNEAGQAIFTSTFIVNFLEGVKVREIETRGKKKKEYFFLWPTGF